MAKAEAKLESVNGSEKPIQPIAANKLELYESRNARWRTVLPSGVKPEEAENPALYTVVSNKLRPFDTIEFLSADANFWGEVLVVASEKGFPVVTKCLRVVEFQSLPKNEHSDLPTGYEIRYDATQNEYRPYRSDGTPMAPSQPTREMARQRLVNMLHFANERSSKSVRRTCARNNRCRAVGNRLQAG